eukprot:scaffold90432_cov34-Prasinocladus_malaysianus.AAC.1
MSGSSSAILLVAFLLATLTPAPVASRAALSLSTDDGNLSSASLPAQIYEYGDAFDLEGRAVTFKAPGMTPCITEGVS